MPRLTNYGYHRVWTTDPTPLWTSGLCSGPSNYMLKPALGALDLRYSQFTA